MQTLGVGAAMRDRTGHSQEQIAIDGMRSVKMQDTSQSTHRIAR
jgi:hypothetical protein